MIKVFLVEDEIIIRNGIKNSINWEMHGYDFVGEASDGELALPMILEKKPDILIGTGNTDCTTGKSIHNIFFISNESTGNDRNSADGIDFLPLPFSAAFTRRSIATLLDQHGGHGDLYFGWRKIGSGGRLLARS